MQPETKQVFYRRLPWKDQEIPDSLKKIQISGLVLIGTDIGEAIQLLKNNHDYLYPLQVYDVYDSTQTLINGTHDTNVQMAGKKSL